MEWFFTIIIPIAAVVIIVIMAKQVAAHSFKCKHCSKEFSIKWQKVIFTEHSGNEYMLECPHCKTKDWCVQQKEK